MAQMTTICPACGSGKISSSQDSPEVRKCDDCGWTGTEEQLIAVPLPENPLSLEVDQDRALEIAKHMSEQYMKLLYAGASQSIGACILQAGLVGKQDSKNLARMLRAACRGAHKATLDEAEAIAKEHKAKGMLS